MSTINVTGQLVPCPTCQFPMVMRNGVAQSRVTLWSDEGVTMMTPHSPDCPDANKVPAKRDHWGAPTYEA